MGVVVMLHVGSHSGPSGRIVEDRVQRAKEGQESLREHTSKVKRSEGDSLKNRLLIQKYR